MNTAMDKLELYQVRDLGQTMGFAANLIRRHWKHMFRTIGLMCLPLVLMASTLYFLGASGVPRSFTPGSGNIPLNLFNTNYFLSLLASYLTYVAVHWGSVYYIQLYHENGPENFQWNDLWAKVFQHGWKLLFANLFVFLFIGVLAFLSFMLIVTVILIPVTIILLLGLIAFSQFWTVIYLYEGRNIFDSLDRAFKLIKKQWWKAIALFICAYAIVAGFILFPAMIGLMIGFLSGSIGFNQNFLKDSMWIILLIQNIGTILGFTVSFFITLSFTSFYLSTVERVEKVSLKARVLRLSEDSEISTYS